VRAAAYVRGAKDDQPHDAAQMKEGSAGATLTASSIFSTLLC